MEEMLEQIKYVLSVPETLISQCLFLPEYVRQTLIDCINFVPWLFFLYYAIELLERFFLKNIHLFIRLIRTIGPIFGVVISVIPECGYQVMVSTFYSRKMITRGTLLAFYISCSDDALPLLFMDLDKAIYILPIVIIKIVVGLLVAFVVDLVGLIAHKNTEDINAINTDLNEPACCHHRIMTVENPPYWQTHPLIHTFNMFMFTLLSLLLINCIINGFGSVEQLATFLMIDSPYQIIGTAIFGLIPNCVVSIILVLLFMKNLISFPALLAGLVTVTGLGYGTLLKRLPNHKDNYFFAFMLVITALGVGYLAYIYPDIVEMLKFGLGFNQGV